MAETFSLSEGQSPLLVSIPHAGLLVPEKIRSRFAPAGRLLADTDWHVDRLYEFLADYEATVLVARYSRYVIDLNRPSDGKALYPGRSETELCPTTTFVNEPVYRSGEAPDAAETTERVETFWRPYHTELQAQLNRIKARHGYALLWDAHSIRSRVARFFDGRLPDLNLGTADGASCASELSDLLNAVLAASNYRSVRNGRFKGGYITRRYGDPARKIHAVQMEIAQINYMSEAPDYGFDEQKARRLRPVLRCMIEAMLAFKE